MKMKKKAYEISSIQITMRYAIQTDLTVWHKSDIDVLDNVNNTKQINSPVWRYTYKAKKTMFTQNIKDCDFHMRHLPGQGRRGHTYKDIFFKTKYRRIAINFPQNDVIFQRNFGWAAIMFGSTQSVWRIQASVSLANVNCDDKWRIIKPYIVCIGRWWSIHNFSHLYCSTLLARLTVIIIINHNIFIVLYFLCVNIAMIDEL